MDDSEPHNLQIDSDAHTAKNKGRRHEEIEDWLNRNLYHPLAFQLAQKLSKTRITPNLVSVAGGLIVILSAYIYTISNWALSPVLALLLHMSWHVIDGTDGDLAHLTGKSGPLGEIVDGLSDYLSHIILYCMIAHSLSAQAGPLIAWAAAIGAGLSRIMQANHYEVSRRQYQWWAYGKSWLKHKPLQAHNMWESIAIWVSKLYMVIASRNNSYSDNIDVLLGETKNSVEKRNIVSKALRNHLLPHLKSITLLSANYRTIALGIAMILGHPLLYFLYEIILLNIIFLWSLRRHKHAIKRFKDAITI